MMCFIELNMITIEFYLLLWSILLKSAFMYLIGKDMN